MESFEEVYQKYLKEVYCFLLRLSGDREIAEELMACETAGINLQGPILCIRTHGW